MRPRGGCDLEPIHSRDVGAEVSWTGEPRGGAPRRPPPPRLDGPRGDAAESAGAAERCSALPQPTDGPIRVPELARSLSECGRVGVVPWNK